VGEFSGICNRFPFAWCFYLMDNGKINTFTLPGRSLKRTLLKQGMWGGRKPSKNQVQYPLRSSRPLKTLEETKPIPLFFWFFSGPLFPVGIFCYIS
jgi:hypothetical protein